MSSASQLAPSTLDPQLLTPVLDQFPCATRWWVAYSGGLDSHVLLQLCHQFLTDLPESVNKPQLCAVHINHQLQEPANRWAEHCRDQAQALNISFIEKKVQVIDLPRKSLEDQARKARYQAFEELLKPDDVLLLGHHANDQAETLMMRLLRGSGGQGLAAMPTTRSLGSANLYRPLLSCSREQIEQFGRSCGLSWVEDPSNAQACFDRNYLRLQVLPIIAERWPHYSQTLSRSASLSAEANQLNQALAALDIERLGLLTEDESMRGQLLLAPLAGLPVARVRNVLRFWLQGLALSMPSEAQLAALIKDVIEARDDAMPELHWPGVSVWRSGGYLTARPSLPDFDAQQCYEWDFSSPLTLAGAGQLRFEQHIGKGLTQQKLNQQGKLTISFRRGGEVFRPAGRGNAKKLKKLFQELAVPYWLRARVPLIYSQGELVAVADQLIAEGWLAGPGEPGLLLKWQQP